MDNAFSWVKKNGGLCTEADYPYTSGTTKDAGDCSTSCSKNTKVAPASYTDVTVNSDAAMMDALNKQPVSVAIEADQSAFQLYKSGVFTATCGTDLDHGVLAVGYGTYIDGTDYYKVKNSWGTSWGMDGYILLERGVSQKEGQCGILSFPSYPNLA
jgi:C1A family cysteine protease